MTTSRWRDPWPSPQGAWADPPWRLAGRVVTAWFGVPGDVAQQVMSPDLWPEETATVRARLRFYDVAFKTLARSANSPTAPTHGRFREAVVAFQARAGGVAGAVSLFMWTDSDPYMAWGREVFGWPLLRGRIDLSGPLWEGQLRAGARGMATLSVAGGSAALLIDDAWHETSERPAGPCWLMPRRMLRRAGLDDDIREVLIVRPTVREPGIRYAATGHTTLDFEAAHPLHVLNVREADYEIVDGFELVVGSDVDVV